MWDGCSFYWLAVRCVARGLGSFSIVGVAACVFCVCSWGLVCMVFARLGNMLPLIIFRGLTSLSGYFGFS